MSNTKHKVREIFCALKSSATPGKHEYSGKLNDPKSASPEEIKEHYISIRPKLNGILKPHAFKPSRPKIERRVNKGRRSTDKQKLN